MQRLTSTAAVTVFALLALQMAPSWAKDGNQRKHHGSKSPPLKSQGIRTQDIMPAHKPIVRDHRTPKVVSSPIVRDHRTPKAGGPIVRDHRSPKVVSEPIVRDHRTMNPNSGVIRDHRRPSPYGGNNPPRYPRPDVSNMSGGVQVTTTQGWSGARNPTFQVRDHRK